QLQALVRDHGVLVVGEGFGAREQLRLPREGLVAPDAVDRAVACSRDDPRARVVGRPAARPALGGDDECILDGVLGEIEIAENASEDCDAARTLVAIGAGEGVYGTTSTSRRRGGPRPCRRGAPTGCAPPGRWPRRATPPRSGSSRRASPSSPRTG